MSITINNELVDKLAQRYCDELTKFITKEEPTPEAIAAMLFAFSWASLTLCDTTVGREKAFTMSSHILLNSWDKLKTRWEQEDREKTTEPKEAT